MKKRKMNMPRVITGVVLLPFVAVVVFLVVMTIVQEKLPIYENPELKNRVAGNSTVKDELTILSWNIGYGGLGREMDFFYEGGKRVRPEREEFNGYMAGIRNFLAAQDSADFIFIQEADLDSKRSYHENEPATIAGVLDSYCYSEARNYVSSFVPLPFTAPMGKVVSGIATYSRINPDKEEKIGFGTKFSWPKQLFLLQRCFLVFRFTVKEGKELVLVNTHNSTFDEKGELRAKELEILRSFILHEYEKGNWVVAGGDWNNNPVGFSKENIHTGDVVKEIEPPIPPGYLPGWRFAFDPSKPTNRDVDGPYRKGKTKTTIIDFFVLSPNVELLSAKTFETGFWNSDHQPTRIKVKLR
jgi:endonuclease/exonuclease/phosphatase family metal-dependent hydrolase